MKSAEETFLEMIDILHIFIQTDPDFVSDVHTVFEIQEVVKNMKILSSGISTYIFFLESTL